MLSKVYLSTKSCIQKLSTFKFVFKHTLLSINLFKEISFNTLLNATKIL